MEQRLVGMQQQHRLCRAALALDHHLQLNQRPFRSGSPLSCLLALEDHSLTYSELAPDRQSDAGFGKGAIDYIYGLSFSQIGCVEVIICHHILPYNSTQFTHTTASAYRTIAVCCEFWL